MIQKLFFGLTFFIILIIVGIYSILFTSFGNGIVASIIEDKANEKQGVNFKVNKFILSTSNIEFDASIDQNSHIHVVGELSLIAKDMNFIYDVKIDDLSKLEKLIDIKLNGSVATNGTVKGNKELLVVNGESNIFSSVTNYNLKLVDFEPSNIILNTKDAKIEELLYLVNQPKYANGLIDIEANIINAKMGNLDGQINTTIKDGLINNELINKEFETKLLNILNFKGAIVTKLEKHKAITKTSIYTTMANVFTNKAEVDLKDMTINSDYLVKVVDLSKLFDVTQTKMRGNIDIIGSIKKDKDLLVKGESEFLDGKIDFKLLNNNFNANINDVEILKVLNMLYYPEIFTSKSKLTIDYNLANKSGDVKGKLIDGQFKQNKYSTIINNFARFDITKEVYESIDLNSNINDNIIKSTINMKSNLTQIDVDPSTLDTKAQTINALVKTNLKGIEFDTKLDGPITSPNVKVDTSKLISSGAKQKAKEKINEVIKKNIGEDAGNLLKGFFN